MLAESCHSLRLLPRFYKIQRLPCIGINNFCTTSPHVEIQQEIKATTMDNFRFRYPEFLPAVQVKKRNLLKERLERRDMLRRRSVMQIPEFYVGSIVAVTSSDKHASDKLTRFLGICIMKKAYGLGSLFILRNVIENQGIEVMYYLYSPIIRKIEVIRLEKRLDEELFYLRDAPNEYSTFPLDMLPQKNYNVNEVPINTLKVKINPRPWLQRYERMDLKGAILPPFPEASKAKILARAKKAARPWEKYDLMDSYRKNVPEEDQKDIFSEICDELHQLEMKQKVESMKKEFVKPARQKLF